MVALVPVQPCQAPLFHEMQVKAFASLLERYQDYDHSPGAESLETVERRLADPAVALAAFIQADGVPVGGIRVKYLDTEEKRRYLLSILFVLPEYRGRKIAQEAIRLAEQSLAPADQWQLITIEQEPELRHLYEKMGYLPTGVRWNIHEGMDLIQYQKNFKPQGKERET